MAARTAGAEKNEIRLRQQDKEHERIMKEVREQFMPIMLHSPDGVYLYLDDNHKICNKPLAEMFGLTVEEWNSVPDFLEGFVAPMDRERFARNFQEHVSELTRPVTFRFTGVRKNGESFAAETVMIPITWKGYPIAYHFVREVK